MNPFKAFLNKEKRWSATQHPCFIKHPNYIIISAVHSNLLLYHYYMKLKLKLILIHSSDNAMLNTYREATQACCCMVVEEISEFKLNKNDAKSC